jgi:tRNA nucleotidyltransferase/poly(A) polymerase
MTTVEFFEVGGCVRDDLLGIRSKDIDFVAVASSFEAMRAELLRRGFKIHLERPEFVTIRAGIPAGDPLRERASDADFVLARRDGPTADGRRPQFVRPGTLHDDLARRDFTVNAIARTVGGELIDPFGGVSDLRAGVLRFVGDPAERIAEDGLRVLRGFRFQVTKGLAPTAEAAAALTSDLAVRMLEAVSVDRIRDEVDKMLAHDTLATLRVFEGMPEAMRAVIFSRGLRLTATTKAP